MTIYTFTVHSCAFDEWENQETEKECADRNDAVRYASMLEREYKREVTFKKEVKND